MKRADISKRLFNDDHAFRPGGMRFDELSHMQAYTLQGGIRELKRDIYKVVFDNISFLSRLDLYMFSDDEMPSLYILYDGAMTLLECVSFHDFIDRFIVTDHRSNVYDCNYGCYGYCITSSNYEAIYELHRQSSNDLLGEKTLEAIRCCDSNRTMSSFFFKLMLVSARMAAITGESNVYNDYRVNSDLHAYFAINKDYCDEYPYYGYYGEAYVYATGKYMTMEKSRKAYELELQRGNFSSIGITPDTPVHLWKKKSEIDYYATPKSPYTPQQASAKSQIPQRYPQMPPSIPQGCPQMPFSPSAFVK